MVRRTSAVSTQPAYTSPISSLLDVRSERSSNATTSKRCDATIGSTASGFTLNSPTPVALRKSWKKLGAVELGAPLVALTGAKLDGKGELYAVTTQDVAAIAVDKRPRVIASVKYAGEKCGLSSMV